MLKSIKNALCTAKSYLLSRAIPVALLTVSIVSATVFLNASIKTVNIFDGEKNYTVRTLLTDIKQVIKYAGIDSESYNVTKSTRVGNTLNLTIQYTFPVYIKCGDATTTVTAVKSTVNDILKLAGYTVDEYDMVQPSADTVITKTSYIDYSDISYITGSYQQAVPCSLETVYSDAQYEGVNTVVNGVDGLQQVNYTKKLINGVDTETTVNEVITLSDVVNGKKIIGTKKNSVITSDLVKSISTLVPASPIALDENGNPTDYKKHITVQATAYTYTGHNCSTGVAPQPGYIAVNPNVIPYGTKLYIKSSDGAYIYGYAVAADTGGFVKSRPNNVDLFFTTKSACSAFGRRNVEIYFLNQ